MFTFSVKKNKKREKTLKAWLWWLLWVITYIFTHNYGLQYRKSTQNMLLQYIFFYLRHLFLKRRNGPSRLHFIITRTEFVWQLRKLLHRRRVILLVTKITIWLYGLLSLQDCIHHSFIILFCAVAKLTIDNHLQLRLLKLYWFSNVSKAPKQTGSVK